MIKIGLIQILRNQLSELELQIFVMERRRTRDLYSEEDINRAKARRDQTIEVITRLGAANARD